MTTSAIGWAALIVSVVLSFSGQSQSGDEPPSDGPALYVPGRIQPCTPLSLTEPPMTLALATRMATRDPDELPGVTPGARKETAPYTSSTGAITVSTACAALNVTERSVRPASVDEYRMPFG